MSVVPGYPIGMMISPVHRLDTRFYRPLACVIMVISWFHCSRACTHPQSMTGKQGLAVGAGGRERGGGMRDGCVEEELIV